MAPTKQTKINFPTAAAAVAAQKASGGAAAKAEANRGKGATKTKMATSTKQPNLAQPPPPSKKARVDTAPLTRSDGNLPPSPPRAVLLPGPATAENTINTKVAPMPAAGANSKLVPVAGDANLTTAAGAPVAAPVPAPNGGPESAPVPSSKDRKSPETNEALLEFHAVLDDPNETTCIWSEDGTEWIIPNKKVFFDEMTRLFHLEKMTAFWRKLQRLEFAKTDKKNKVTLKHPLFQRGKPELCRGMRSILEESQKPKAAAGPMCTCQCCEFLKGEGEGKKRVWFAKQMCPECLGFFDDEKVQESEEREDELEALLPFLEDHLKVKDHRVETKKATYDAVAKRKRSMQRAKKSQDLPAYVALCRESPSVQRYLRLLETLTEEERCQLDPKTLLAECPEMIACGGTDGYFTDGVFGIDVKAESANIARAAIGQAHEWKKIVYGDVGKAEPSYRDRIKLRPIGGSYSKETPKSYTIGDPFDHSDDENFEWTMQMGKEVHNLRKAIQAKYDTGVTARMENQEEPTLSLDVVKSLIEQHLHDRTIKKIFLQFFDDTTGEETDEATDLFRRAVRGGTFYSSIRSSVAAWWYDVFVNMGFGSSHGCFPFNPDAFWEVVGRSSLSKKEFLCRFLLAWAGYDGSILEGYFEVLVPYDTRDVSVKKLFVKDIFEEIFEMKPWEGVAWTKIEDGKSIVKLRIHRKKDRKELAQQLLPYASEYLSRDRLANLKAWLKLD